MVRDSFPTTIHIIGQFRSADHLISLRDLQLAVLEPFDFERDRLAAFEDELVGVEFEVAALDVEAMFTGTELDVLLIVKELAQGRVRGDAGAIFAFSG